MVLLFAPYIADYLGRRNGTGLQAHHVYFLILMHRSTRQLLRSPGRPAAGASTCEQSEGYVSCRSISHWFWQQYQQRHMSFANHRSCTSSSSWQNHYYLQHFMVSGSYCGGMDHLRNADWHFQLQQSPMASPYRPSMRHAWHSTSSALSCP